MICFIKIEIKTNIIKNSITAKVKNPNKMSVWKVNRTTNSSDQIPYGLAYSPIFGTRIEDDIIVTKNGAEILNKTSKEFQVIS